MHVPVAGDGNNLRMPVRARKRVKGTNRVSGEQQYNARQSVRCGSGRVFLFTRNMRLVRWRVVF